MPIKHYIDSEGKHFFKYEKSSRYYFNIHSQKSRKEAWEKIKKYVAKIKIKQKMNTTYLF